MTTEITLQGFELWTHIGVPEEERMAEQRIFATVTLEVKDGKGRRSDSLADTVDYEVLYRMIKELAKREHKTLEGFAEEIATMVLKDSRIAHVTVLLRKFILPGTKEASVTITRNR